MKFVATAAQSRETDKRLIDEKHVAGVILMENAAFAVTQSILKHDGNTLIICGTGNNGGDGFAILRQLHMHGRYAVAALVGNEAKITGDARINYEAALNLGLKIIRIENAQELEAVLIKENIKIIADAMFGTGLVRNLEGLYADVVQTVNDYSALKIAVDIPSGISSDSGAVCGCAIRADETISFQTAKRGHILYPGREFCGRLSVAPIAPQTATMTEYFLEDVDIKHMLPPRRRNSHKGTYGKVLIIGGSNEYAGACIMAAVSALRSGAGIVRVFSTKRVADELLHIAPEIISCTVNNWNDISPDLKSELSAQIKAADAVAVGMGMGLSQGVTQILDSAISAEKKLLIDADGLNILSKNKELFSKLHGKCVLTPHVGEFSRLIGIDVPDIVSDPIAYATAFAEEHGVNLLLKSSTSIITNPIGNICYNLTGNSGLAKGGSGDTLAGLIVSLMAQGLSVYDAACVGSYILGAVAESVDMPERTMSATVISEGFSSFFSKTE